MVYVLGKCVCPSMMKVLICFRKDCSQEAFEGLNISLSIN